MLHSILQGPGPRQAPGSKKGERDRVKIPNSQTRMGVERDTQVLGTHCPGGAENGGMNSL